MKIRGMTKERYKNHPLFCINPVHLTLYTDGNMFQRVNSITIDGLLIGLNSQEIQREWFGQPDEYFRSGSKYVFTKGIEEFIEGE